MISILPITLTTAGAAAILNIWLAFRCGQVRMASKILIGDGDHPLLRARMRAQANFIEFAPLVLILLGLIELAGGNPMALWIAAILFILARIAHGLGMERPAPNPLRAGGAMVSALVLLGLAAWAIAIPYLAGSITSGTEVVPIG